MNNLVPHGQIDQSQLGRKNDYLYRISLKSVILNAKREVLVVKELDRQYWDLPGGGMDHGESIKLALKRELFEEVGYTGDFVYNIIHVEEPAHSKRANVMQIRLIFSVQTLSQNFEAGIDASAIRFINPSELRDSNNETERRVYEYARLVL